MKSPYILLFTMALLVCIGGCGITQPTLTTFAPPENSLFNLVFSYPANWKWTFLPQSDSNTYQLALADIYPNSRKAEILVVVDVHISDFPENDMDSVIDFYMETKTTLPQFDILSDKTVLIDGREARWIVTRTTDNPPTGKDRPSIDENIFVLLHDRFYEIGIHYTEFETNQDFHEEFLAMIASIKFLP